MSEPLSKETVYLLELLWALIGFLGYLAQDAFVRERRPKHDIFINMALGPLALLPLVVWLYENRGIKWRKENHQAGCTKPESEL